MMLDQRFRVSNGQAITVTAASTNTVDLDAVLRDVSDQRRLVMDFNVTEAFVVNSGTPLLIINNVADNGDTLVGAYATFLGSSVGLEAADLTLGAHIYVPIHPLTTSQAALFRASAAADYPHRFFGALYTVAGGDFSAGKITAHLCIDPRSEMRIEHYKDALN